MKYVSDKHFIYLVNPPFALREVIKSQLNGVWFDNKDVGKGWRFPRNLHAYRELYKFFPELRTNSQFVADGQLAGSEINYWKREIGRAHV